jgi:REP element-mobilizing transposase RayT
MVYRDRGYLPHLELPEATYFVTFRLAGTLPKKVVDELKKERQFTVEITKKQNRELTPREESRLKYLRSTNIQQYLDKGIGDCWLRKSEIATIVKESIHYFDGSRYISHAYCIMPNHLHWLLTSIDQSNSSSRENSRLIPIMHSIKSYTAHQANKLLNREGRFWSKEYYDHLVRSSEEFGRLLFYIIENPVKAGLCKKWNEWPWTICSEKIQASLEMQYKNNYEHSPPEAGGTNC